MPQTVQFTPEIGHQLCVLMADGKGLHELCDQKNLNRATVYQWFTTDPEARDKYAQAREMLAHKYAVEVIMISDDEGLDPQARRVRCDARKWAAAKLLPRVYSDKVVHSGDPDNPIEVRVQSMSKEERLLEAQKLLAEIARLSGLPEIGAPTIENAEPEK
jgi:hypothetical protein